MRLYKVPILITDSYDVIVIDNRKSRSDFITLIVQHDFTITSFNIHRYRFAIFEARRSELSGWQLVRFSARVIPYQGAILSNAADKIRDSVRIWSSIAAPRTNPQGLRCDQTHS